MDKINELGNIFSEMVENHESFRGEWRNIPLGKKAFAIMRDELPLRVEGELTPYTRIVGMLRIEDYLNPEISMEEWCLKYHVNLKFDPVERSEQWENCIYDVEKECESKLEGERRGMGFCYSYWSTKKSVLSKHGIDWSSPAAMNPRVMFD